MKRAFSRFAVVFTVFLVALSASLVASAAPSQDKQPKKPAEELTETRKAEIDRVAKDILSKGGSSEDLDKALAPYGLEPVTPDSRTTKLTRADSSGGEMSVAGGASDDLSSMWAQMYRHTSGQYYVSGYWNFIDGNTPLISGPYEVQSFHFQDQNGQKPANILWASSSNNKLEVYTGNMTTCSPGWIYKTDFAGGGIIWNFADSNGFNGYCGDHGGPTAWLAQPPATPFYLIYSYEHNWTSGTFESAEIGYDSQKGGLALKVKYIGTTNSWRNEVFNTYTSLP